MNAEKKKKKRKVEREIEKEIERKRCQRHRGEEECEKLPGAGQREEGKTISTKLRASAYSFNKT